MVINSLLSKSGVTPVVGMGATVLMLSDRNPATIVEVSKNLRKVTVQDDHHAVVSGSVMDGSAEYTFSPNPNASREVYTLRKNGRYVREGESMKNGTGLRIGERDRYYDPCF